MSEMTGVLVRARFAPPGTLYEKHVVMGAGEPPTMVLRFTMEGDDPVLSITAGWDGMDGLEGVSEALDYATEIVVNAVNQLKGETNE